jgi:hypothetical protein
LSTANPNPGALANQRRSQRVALAVRLVVSGVPALGPAFVEETTTVVVNAHGAMIQLREPVQKGQMLNVRNAVTGEELACKIVDVTAGSSGQPEVGVEFTEPHPHFWRVSFPPSDWNPRSPEAKRFSPAASAASRPAPLQATKK